MTRPKILPKRSELPDGMVDMVGADTDLCGVPDELRSGPTCSRCTAFEPNDWVEYVDNSGRVVHIDEFFNPWRQIPRLRK